MRYTTFVLSLLYNNPFNIQFHIMASSNKKQNVIKIPLVSFNMRFRNTQIIFNAICNLHFSEIFHKIWPHRMTLTVLPKKFIFNVFFFHHLLFGKGRDVWDVGSLFIGEGRSPQRGSLRNKNGIFLEYLNLIS